MSNTYTKEISVMQPVMKRLHPEDAADMPVWTEELGITTATFKELSRTDRTQRKLAMFINTVFRKFGFKEVDDPRAEGGKRFVVEIDDEAVSDLTEKFIDTCSVYTDQYTEANKNEILNDSGAMYAFGMWLLTEKITPFFSILRETSTK